MSSTTEIRLPPTGALPRLAVLLVAVVVALISLAGLVPAPDLPNDREQIQARSIPDPAERRYDGRGKWVGY